MIETCWTVVARAANGDSDACNEFARSYLSVVRAFLVKRWQASPRMAQVDDAIQEVFLDLFRSGGALTRFDRKRVRNFRTFLFGVAHKVALRHEERLRGDRVRNAQGDEQLAVVADDAASASRVFDREWATSLLRRARQRQLEQATKQGEEARRRVELLRLRFGEGLPIRDIAKRWGIDSARVHHEYAKARVEFKEALRTEVAFHHRGTASEVELECRRLLELFE